MIDNTESPSSLHASVLVSIALASVVSMLIDEAETYQYV